MNHFDSTTLSPREGQVLDAISSGCPNKVIAYDLGISVRTLHNRLGEFAEEEAKGVSAH